MFVPQLATPKYKPKYVPMVWFYFPCILIVRGALNRPQRHVGKLEMCVVRRWPLWTCAWIGMPFGLPGFSCACLCSGLGITLFFEITKPKPPPDAPCTQFLFAGSRQLTVVSPAFCVLLALVVAFARELPIVVQLFSCCYSQS